jgi:hypothetical protein
MGSKISLLAKFTGCRRWSGTEMGAQAGYLTFAVVEYKSSFRIFALFLNLEIQAAHSFMQL